MRHILDQDVSSFLQNPPVAFMGWDDRLGRAKLFFPFFFLSFFLLLQLSSFSLRTRLDNGFCGHCTTEAQLAFAGLLARAVGDFARALAAAGPTSRVLAPQYNATAAHLRASMRARPSAPPSTSWLDDYGLHAAGNAINAGATTAAEEQALLSRVFNDSVTACSWSPFNQYWLLQALGNMDRMDYALASLRLCWGTQLTLGRGCFDELFSPEWATFLPPAYKFPTRPSLCHVCAQKKK